MCFAVQKAEDNFNLTPLVAMPFAPLLLAHGALAFGTTEIAFLAVYAATVLLAPSHATLIRLAAVIALFALTCLLQDAFFQWCSNPHWRGFVAASVPVQLMSASDIIFITRLSSAAIPGKNIIHRAYKAIVLLLNLRRIGTVWQVKNVPATTSLTRSQFLQERICTTFVAYLALDAMISGPAPPTSMITARKQTLFDLHTLSRDDIIFRVAGSLFYWFSGFLLIIIVSNTVAIALVATGLSSPQDRPPLFGSIKDAYTIRRCWGNVWHQCLRRGLTTHADFVSDKILRIPRGTLLSRYTRIFIVFIISGIIHHVCVRGMGVPSEESGGLVFFPLQALGIMVEDAVQAALVGKTGFRNAGVRRLFGYVWVVAYLGWSTPTWFYPQSRVGTDAEILLPVRVARPLIGKLRGFVKA
ncbi:hypothetical protein SLS54_002982 [Diplodia seriata]